MPVERFYEATLGPTSSYYFQKLLGHYSMNLNKASLKLVQDGLTEQELGEVNIQLQLVAETCAAHLAYMQDADEINHDDLGMQVLEEGFLFLYQVWLEAQVPINKTGMH